MAAAGWEPWSWVAGMAVAYALFLYFHPLRPAIAAGWKFTGCYLWLWAGLAVFLLVPEVVDWLHARQLPSNEKPQGFGYVNPPDLCALARGALVPSVEATRWVYWFAVPWRTAFLVGPPLGLAYCLWQIRAVWRGALGVKRVTALAVMGVVVLVFFGWLQHILTKLGVDPEILFLRHPGAWFGNFPEVFGGILYAFSGQAVLFIFASLTFQNDRGGFPLMGPFHLAFHALPRLLPLVILVAVAFVSMRDFPGPDPVWLRLSRHTTGIVSSVIFSALPICIILINQPWNRILQAALGFPVRTLWSYGCLFVLCQLQFYVLILIDRALEDAFAQGGIVLLGWEIVFAVLRALLSLWMIFGFSVFFCQRIFVKKHDHVNVQANT